jgi:hypothetical protein
MGQLQELAMASALNDPATLARLVAFVLQRGIDDVTDTFCAIYCQALKHLADTLPPVKGVTTRDVLREQCREFLHRAPPPGTTDSQVAAWASTPN